MQRLRGVAGLPSVVGYAGLAISHDQARFVTAAVNMLARHHESASPITQASAPGPIVGRTAAGALIVPAPVDYVAWTQGVARIPPAPGSQSITARGVAVGLLSRRAHKELVARAWQVQESYSIGAER